MYKLITRLSLGFFILLYVLAYKAGAQVANIQTGPQVQNRMLVEQAFEIRKESWSLAGEGKYAQAISLTKQALLLLDHADDSSDLRITRNELNRDWGYSSYFSGDYEHVGDQSDTLITDEG